METLVNLDAGLFLHVLPDQHAIVKRECEILPEDWTYCTLVQEANLLHELAQVVREYARPHQASVWDIPERSRSGLFARPVRINGRAVRRTDTYFPIRRGDIVRSGRHTDLFDGKEMTELDSQLAYQQRYSPFFTLIPPTFTVVTEFPIRYWARLLPNLYVPFPHHRFLDSIMETMQVRTTKTDSRPYIWSSFVHQDQQYHLLYFYSGWPFEKDVDSASIIQALRNPSFAHVAVKEYQHELESWPDGQLLFQAGFVSFKKTQMIRSETMINVTNHNTLVFAEKRVTSWLKSCARSCKD